jgi:hypothetical protein
MYTARILALISLSVISLSATTVFAQQIGLPGESSSSLGTLETLISPAADGGGAWSAAGGHAAASATTHANPFSGFALGVNAGLLGIGVQAATPLSKKLNLSGGANFFGYTDNLTSDGVNYDANLRFRSAEASLDWFPMAGGFHISPGTLLYNGNQITANATVPGGQSFTLNSVQYLSSSSDPVTGTGSLTFNKAAPKLTVGFGNMIPRSGRHVSVPVDLGFAWVGDPKVVLNLAGTVCDPGGQNCQAIASSTAVQANIAGQQQKLQNDASPARIYPIFRAGLAYSF